MKRQATKKNISEFMSKNSNVKNMIDKIINDYFLTDELIIDGTVPYENIIKDFVRNYEIVSEGDILKYLLDKTENKEKLYRINIAEKTEYYIRKLRIVTDKIFDELNNDTSGKTIKLSERIDMNSDMISAICKFVGDCFESDGFNAYEDCVERVYGKNMTHVLYMGKFIRKFIDQNHLIWEENGIHLGRPNHVKINFHCYGFNNNSDVLFTKQDHCFSHYAMKYDFEEGYIPDIPQQYMSPQIPMQQYVQHPVQNINTKNNSGCLGVIIALISTIALGICML